MTSRSGASDRLLCASRLRLLIAAVAVWSCGGEPTALRAGVAAHFEVIGGDAQRGVVGMELNTAIVVRVTDDAGRPVPNRLVNFVVVAGGGHVFAGAATTNDVGEARERWTLGIVAADSQRVEVRSVDPATGAAITYARFSAVALPGAAAALTITGDTVRAATVADVISVGARVSDQYGNPVAAIGVVLAVTAGNGSVSSAPRTDSAGLTSVTWTLDRVPGSNRLSASIASGATRAVTVMTAAATPAAITIAGDTARAGTVADVILIDVRVTDRFGNPVSRVPVPVTVTAGGGRLSTVPPTDSAGRSTVTWTLGRSPGVNRVSVAVAAVPERTIMVTSTAAAAAMLAITGDTTRAGTVGEQMTIGVRVSDQYGNPVARATVTLVVTAGNGTLSIAPPTDSAGLTSVVWTLGPLPGTNRVTATAIAGGPVVQVTAIASAIVPARVEIVSGATQRGVVGVPLAQPLVAKIVDATGRPIANQTVAFAVIGGGGRVDHDTVVTGPTGDVQTRWTLGTSTSSAQTLEVRALAYQTHVLLTSAQATAIPLPDSATTLLIVGDSGRAGVAGARAAVPLAVQATDRFGNGVAGVAIGWTNTSDAAVLAATVATDSVGIARNEWTLGTVAGRLDSARATLNGVVARTFVATPVAGPFALLVKVGGDTQSGTIGDQLPVPLLVRSADRFGNATGLVDVRWTVGNASQRVTTDYTGVTRSDYSGLASVQSRLGIPTGTQSVTATSGSVSTTFTATARWDGRFIKVAAGAPSCGVAADRALYCWPGPNMTTLHQRFYAFADTGTAPRRIELGGPVDTVVAGSGFVCGLVGTTVSCQGGNVYYTLGARAPTSPIESCVYHGPCYFAAATPVPNAPPMRALSAFADHVCGIATDGRVFCWGSNGAAQTGRPGNFSFDDRINSCRLALNPQPCQPTPSPVDSMPIPATAVAVGTAHSCALSNGTAYCWGDNWYGELGTVAPSCVRNGTCSDFGVRAVPNMSSLVDIRAGMNQTCARTAAGIAYCWGSNTHGQLGIGTADSLSHTPSPVAGGQTFASLTIGSGHMCGLTDTGKAFCWGDNTSGQLGIGTVGGMETSPRAVGGTLVFRALSAGAQHTCGVTAENRVYCWGSDSFSQLGALGGLDHSRASSYFGNGYIYSPHPLPVP